MFRPAFKVSVRNCAKRSSPTVSRYTQHATTSQSKPPTFRTTARLVGKRLLQCTLFAVVSATTIYQGAHLYIEHVQMASEADPEVKKWKWDTINNNWTGDPIRGGTSPALGFRARHLLHGAFAAYNQDASDTTIILEDTPPGDDALGKDQAKIAHVVEARLNQTEQHLRNAIVLTEGKLSQNGYNSHAFAILLLRHASILEQIGVGMYLLLAREDYERAWQYCSDPKYREFIAWKLGDLNSRLGHSDEALTWWDRSLQIIQESCTGSVNVSTSNFIIPQSPLAQRILSSVLVSKSAHLAASGKFGEAQALEEASLQILRSIRPPDSISSASPPQALHALYLLQRSSLLSVHHAEVLHAQRRPLISSIQWLTSAAESSERVVKILTGSKIEPVSTTDSSNPFALAANNSDLLSVYVDSHSMNTPARALLRDARHTAAEAWNMMGILYENKDGPSSHSALQCFERAVTVAGTLNRDGDIIQPAKDTLDSDWHVYWSNYQRAKGAQAGKKIQRCMGFG